MAQALATDCRILVVDDNAAIVLLLQELLTAEGHQVETAANGAEALERIAVRRPDLILLDLDMPQIDGYEVCRRVKQDPATRLIPVVIVTAEPGFQARLCAWELGADDFLSKPFHHVEVLTRCRSLLRSKRLIDSLDPSEAVMFALARTVEAKSPYTHGHSERVKDYALRLAQRLGLPEDEREVLGKGALLHDIGKISIPDSLLNKPGPLTAAEFECVKDHTVQGVRIVEPLPSMRGAIPLIRWHHERLDGLGYPDGLRGDAIPLLVRVLAVADVYDSLVSERPYRPAISPTHSLEILLNEAFNGGLDLHIVESFGTLLAEEGPLPRHPSAAARPSVGNWGSHAGIPIHP